MLKFVSLLPDGQITARAAGAQRPRVSPEGYPMRHMQIIRATTPDAARQAYAELLQRRGITLSNANDVFVEVVHRGGDQAGSWLCYVGGAGQQAA